MKLDKEKQQISLLTSTFSVPLKIISLKTAHWIKKRYPPFLKTSFLKEVQWAEGNTLKYYLKVVIMKVKNIRNINKFFSTIDKYDGKVKLVTAQGDCLNLKCKLSQCVAIVRMENDINVKNGKIVFEND